MDSTKQALVTVAPEIRRILRRWAYEDNTSMKRIMDRIVTDAWEQRQRRAILQENNTIPYGTDAGR